MILKRLSSAFDQKIRRFLNKDYRDSYLQNHVRGGIAYQIRALRTKADLSQVEFAELTGKKQSTISRLENTQYGKVSVQTLLDIASASNVALLVRFVDYPQFLRVTSDMSPDALAPENIYETEALSSAGNPPIFVKADDDTATLLQQRPAPPVTNGHFAEVTKLQ